MTEVAVTTGAISRAELQSSRHHQQTNVLQAVCPSCRQTNSVKAVKGKGYIASYEYEIHHVWPGEHNKQSNNETKQ